MEIKGSSVLITGGCGGIGTAIAEAFLKLDKHVTLCDRQTSGADRLLREYARLRVIEVDLGDPFQIDNAVAPLLAAREAPDILVNNVGISPKSDSSGKSFTTWDMPLEQWNAVLAVNLTSYFYCSKLAIPAMVAKRWGRIINIASLATRTGGHVAPAHYVASKAGVLGLTKVVAKEVAPFNITVNAINPGRIDTAMIHDVPDEVNAAYVKRIPLGRLGLPKDIAGVAIFLASNLADYLTGTTIEVNGGLYMGS